MKHENLAVLGELGALSPFELAQHEDLFAFRIGVIIVYARSRPNIEPPATGDKLKGWSQRIQVTKQVTVKSR
jgi:hypothetical protein